MLKEAPYTLLADDTQPISIEENLLRSFKAHLVLTLIFNKGVTLSDNQVICSKNLRRLVRRDGVIRKLFEEKQFTLAVRSDRTALTPIKTPKSISSVNKSFYEEGKFDVTDDFYTDLSDIDFMDEFSTKRVWDYDDIRKNYTENSKKVILQHLGDLLSERDFEVVQEEIHIEEERDAGLGRIFLRDRLYGKILPRLQSRYEGLESLIQLCSDAHYITNLPRTLNLDPIYGSGHSKVFDIIRNTNIEDDLLDEPVVKRKGLDKKHFVEGLINLDVDSIFELQNSGVLEKYRESLQFNTGDDNDMRKLRNAYVVASERIEKEILDNWGNSRPSPALERVQDIQLRAKRKNLIGGAILDIATSLTVSLPGGGIVIEHIINRNTKKKIGTDQDILAIERGDITLRQDEMRDELHTKGRTETISLSGSFQNETMTG